MHRFIFAVKFATLPVFIGFPVFLNELTFRKQIRRKSFDQIFREKAVGYYVMATLLRPARKTPWKITDIKSNTSTESYILKNVLLILSF